MQIESDKELEQTFIELRNRWKKETFILSSSTKITRNENYQSIIQLGVRALPLILKDLEETSSFWFEALEALTGLNLVPEEYWGNIPKMTQIWVDWGRRNNYL
mgnify:FL=1